MDRLQFRRDTSERWSQFNPILLEGEVGYVTDNPNQYKIGDGINTWNSLPLRGFDGNIVQELGDSETAVMSQKVTTDHITEYNVSKQFPTGGFSGGNTYTLETAIAKVPTALQTVGMRVTFISNETSKFVTYLYKGNYWTVGNFYPLIAQELGDSETAVMSQKASTERFSHYTFIFPSGRIPVVERTGNNEETIFTVTIFPGDYYYFMNNTTGELSSPINIPTKLILEVKAGEILFFNMESLQFEVVDSHVLSGENKIILLYNMRYASGVLTDTLLNTLILDFNTLKSNLICSIIFSQASYPSIELQSDYSYKVIFKPVTYYVKNWTTGSINANNQFLNKSEEERTIIVSPTSILYYSKDSNSIKIEDTPQGKLSYGDIILLENARFCEYGQLSNAILDNTTKLAELSYSELLENYKTSCSIISPITKDIIPYIKPIRKLHIYVDEENVTDTFGLSLLRNPDPYNGQAVFYIYDVEKSYNICVINIDIPEGESSLRGVTKLYGNYTVEGRITCYLDAVIDWNLFSVMTSTTSPTILFSAQSTGSLEFKSKFNISESSRITRASDEFFRVKVNGTKQNPDDGFIGKSSDVVPINTEYEDRCHFVMPANDGNPVKLMILCHGGGLFISDSYDAMYHYQNIGQIFNALGYATLTFNGLPKEWADEHGIGIDRQCGNWMANESIERAYEYVVNKYNIDTNGCYVYGGSQGGMVAENVVELTNIPILASVLESPAISMQYAQLYIGGALAYLQALYGFNSQSTYDKNKCIGLDPFIRNMSEDIIVTGNSVSTLNVDIDNMTQRKFRKNSPVMIIRSLADNTISPVIMGAYAKAIINGGGNCELLTYTDAQHSTTASTSVVGSIEGIDIRASLYEILNFFRRHSGYSLNKIILS